LHLYGRPMDDTYDDIDPSWFPDSKRIVFSSDRPHPDNDFFLKNPNYESNGETDYRTIYHRTEYGNYNLFILDIETNKIKSINCGPGQNRQPVVSPNGGEICFVSNRNGIDNFYITHIDSSTSYAITDILTGVSSPSWSPDGKKIAFSAFNKGGFDIFMLKEWSSAGDNGVLEATDFAKGKYGNPENMEMLFIQKKAFDTTDTPKDESSLAIHRKTADSDDDNAIAADTTRIENGEYIFV